MDPKTTQAVVDEPMDKRQHADAALKFVEQHEGVTFTAAEEKALVKKIDLVLMPLVCCKSTLTSLQINCDR